MLAYFGVRWASPSKGSAATDWQSVGRGRPAFVLFLMFLPLLVIKYADFLLANVAGLDHKVVNLPLPLGISFVTFTLAAYFVDLVNYRYPRNHSFKLFLTYVMFFPHLIAGPILRPGELLPQLARGISLKLHRVKFALVLFMVGLAKKLIIADQLAPTVEAAFGSKSAGALEYGLAVYAFTVQIYCDFSGYTDMALALAYLVGIQLPNNFQRPYISTSLVEFWRRWHITLSRWLRDYLYIPLGGNRGGQLARFRNIVITMTLGGLWHGASWTFVAWGLLHGIGITLSHVITKHHLARSIPRWISTLAVFHFVAFAWIFFRAGDLATAFQVIHGMVAGPAMDLLPFLDQNLFPIVLIVFALAIHRFDRHDLLRWLTKKDRFGLAYAVCLFLLVLSVILGYGTSAKFIYFDF